MTITADGVAVIGIKDCSGNMASGVWFAAKAEASSPIMGLHFSIQHSFPIPEAGPTGSAGLGGLVNLTPGEVNVYGYVDDGCIVAQARIISEASRVAYVFLVPNGFGGNNG